jgi:hypothetical protein
MPSAMMMSTYSRSARPCGDFSAETTRSRFTGSSSTRSATRITAIGGADQVEAGYGINALPLAEVLHDVFGLAVLVLQALAELTEGMWTMVFTFGSSSAEILSV